MKAAIVAIGTEVTSGEIVNSNSSALAARLNDLKFDVVLHMAVPDDFSLMYSSIETASQIADLIVVTGGLGPTSDDFTRDVISQWLDQPLEFDENSWRQVESLLKSRNVPLREEHKNQCRFPKAAQVLLNTYGTANGFLSIKSIGSQKKVIVALPGPPREIQSVFENQLNQIFEEMSPQKEFDLDVLCCLGLPESEVAAQTEEVFKNIDVTLGYRASMPYVYVKVWSKAAQNKEVKKALTKLKALFAQHVVRESLEDPVLILKNLLQAFSSVHVFDSATAGFLSQRLLPVMEAKNQKPFLRFETLMGQDESDNLTAEKVNSESQKQTLTIEIKVQSDDLWQLKFKRFGAEDFVKSLNVPHRYKTLDERARKFLAEMVIHYLIKWLN